MNYEQILDEIMVNTLSAKQLVWYPQKDFHYAVCPSTLEFHTSIFLSSALLCLDQEKPLIILIQVDELDENAMIFSWKIWPHFWRIRDFNETIPDIFSKNNIQKTEKNHYQYLDKLFCYLSVINTNKNHIVVFIKKWEKNSTLTDTIKELLKKDYTLLVISNAYQDLPSDICKDKAENLISHLKTKSMNLEEKNNFPALNVLSELLPTLQNPDQIEQLINSWEMGFSKEKSTSLRFMLS